MVFGKTFGRKARRSRPPGYRPHVGALEDRTLLSFLSLPSYAAGDQPQGVAVGDFTGDGTTDLAVASGGGVSVLLGNGAGTFQAPVIYVTQGNTTSAVAVGDFNGDGIPDLAVANEGATVSVLLGKGDGSFQAPRNYQVGSAPLALAVGDFAGNGILDLAVANNGFGIRSSVSVLLGNGDGTFKPAVNYQVARGASAVAVGDFTASGIPDLVVASYDPSSNPGTLSVLLGNGDGTFQTGAAYPAGNVTFVAAADFNGDGRTDLVTNGAIWLGNGDGTFQAPRYLPAGGSSLVVGDFNGDGTLDLAALSPNTVSVMLGNGDGSFQAPTVYDAGVKAAFVAAGNFTGDGTLDLAITDDGTYPNFEGGVNVLLGNGDGSFRPTFNYAAGVDPYAVAAGDLTGDGFSDLVVADGGDLHGQGSGVSVLLSNGDGSFQAPVLYATAGIPVSVAVGDFNGDGIPDLAAGTYIDSVQGAVDILLGNGDGTFQAPQSFPTGSDPVSVVVGDFNGDGKLDLAVADYGSSGVSVLLGNGDGTFQAQRTLAAGNYPHSMAVGDFNGDGHLDLATNTGKILLGNGDGTFQAPTTFAAVGGSAVAVGDFTGDGHLDLAVTGPGIPNGGVGVYLGNGDGTFQAPRYNLVDLFPNALAVADFNGDGIPDLAVSGNSSVGVLLGNGNGTFQAADDYPAGPKPTAVVSGDFNGDGFPDLAVINSTNDLPNPSTVTVLVNAADASADHPAAASKPHRPARASLTVDPLSAQAALPDPRAVRPLPSTAGEPPTPAPRAPADFGTSQPVLTPTAALLPVARHAPVGRLAGWGDPLEAASAVEGWE